LSLSFSFPVDESANPVL
jgi:hypothetical protein